MPLCIENAFDCFKNKKQDDHQTKYEITKRMKNMSFAKMTQAQEVIIKSEI